MKEQLLNYLCVNKDVVSSIFGGEVQSRLCVCYIEIELLDILRV